MAIKPPLLMNFYKIQAQGNSYVFFDFSEKSLPEIDVSKLARDVSSKEFGIGSDGMVMLFADKGTDAMMRIWNKDGSEAETCGSAIRAAMALLYRKSKINKESFFIKTSSEVISGRVKDQETDYQVSINLNNIKTIPYGERVSADPVENLIDVGQWIGLPVSVGNPHFVIIDRFQEMDLDITSPDMLRKIGPLIGKDEKFPEGTNVELVKIINPQKVAARVWERGTGETLACGTGACAIAFAGLNLGFLDKEVEVLYPGGNLKVSMDCPDCQCTLSGSVGFICKGIYEFRETEQ